MADLNEIVDTLSGLTVMEAAELAKLLEEKWGVSAAAPVAVAAAAGGAGGEAAAEAKDDFDVILTGFGDKKIQVIKEIRGITGPRPQGSQGTRRGRAEADQGRCSEGRGGRDPEEDRGSWRSGRRQVGRRDNRIDEHLGASRGLRRRPLRGRSAHGFGVSVARGGVFSGLFGSCTRRIRGGRSAKCRVSRPMQGSRAVCREAPQDDRKRKAACDSVRRSAGRRESAGASGV